MLLFQRKCVIAVVALLAVHNKVVVPVESVPTTTSATSRNLKSIKNDNNRPGMRGLRATRKQQQQQLQQLIQQERALKGGTKGIKGEKGGKTESTAETTENKGGGGGGKNNNKGGGKNTNSFSNAETAPNTKSGAATGASETQTQTTATSQSTTATSTSEGLSLIGPGGVAESVPCVAWTTVTETQKLYSATARECAALNNGDYPYTGGCCRAYVWLIYDPTGRIHASLPCVCNAFTRDPSEFGQAAAAPTTSSSTSTTTTTTEASPTNAPITPVPTKVLTSAPTTVAPTTASPTKAPITPPAPTTSGTTTTTTTSTGFPTTAGLSTQDGQSLIPLETCATPENNIFWNEVAFPELARNAKCTYTQECMEQFGSDSCCLASYCFCGKYQPGRANEECVPIHYTTSTGREVAPSGGTAGSPDSLQDFVDRTDDSSGTNNNIDSPPQVSVPTVSPTTIAPTTVSPTTLSPTTVPPTTAPPTQEPTTQQSLVTAPAPDTCAYEEKNIYWDDRVYPQYASYTQCTTSSQCRRVPGACCLATFCLCGLYRPDREVTDCLP